MNKEKPSSSSGKRSLHTPLFIYIYIYISDCMTADISLKPPRLRMTGHSYTHTFSLRRGGRKARRAQRSSTGSTYQASFSGARGSVTVSGQFTTPPSRRKPPGPRRTTSRGYRSPRGRSALQPNLCPIL
jgi:hypothetical protein